MTMDKGIASFTILPFFLCFLFTFSLARNPFESVIIDIIDHVNHDPLSFYENNNLVQDDPNSILFPIDDKPEPEPTAMIRLEPEPKFANSKPTEPKPKPKIVYSTVLEVPEEMSKTNPDPNAAFITSDLRLIDPRSIPRRPVPLSFRVGHRCNQHQNCINPHYKPWKLAQQRLPRPRPTNDVKVNGVELNKEFDHVAARDDDWARQVPTESMMRLRNNIEQKLSREHNDLALERNELWRRMYPRHHRHEPKNKDNTTGHLMKRIRKFLNPF